MQEYISLELSKKLIELGAPKEAEKWLENPNRNLEYYPAFSCRQLLEWLPYTISRDEIDFDFYIYKDERGYIVGYAEKEIDGNTLDNQVMPFIEKDFLDAIAKMLIYLLENGWKFEGNLIVKKEVL